jgi:ubiquinone/menaquinone biosynthesis C-methylase UbiE
MHKTLILLTAFTAAAASAQTDAGHPRIKREEIQQFERQEITVPDFEAAGYILDLGGGGEGVIGRLKPSQVVAIDLSKRELAGAPAGPLKIVMDATDLKFLDRSFNTVTAFFLLMYVPAPQKQKVFDEAMRVLAPGGRFLIWDAVIPARTDPTKKIALFPMRIKLPTRTVNTGYGSPWQDTPRNAGYYAAMAAKAGFQVAARQENAGSFYLELRK